MMIGGQAPQIGNIDLVKQLNSAVIYRLIDQQGPISRIQIAETSHLAPASITKITRQLLDRGLIKEIAQQVSTGGRRAISIVTEVQAFHTIAIRLGRHGATIVLYDLSGKNLSETAYLLAQRTQESLQTALLKAIAHFIKHNQHKIRELIAIAITLPGLVDSEIGVVKYMPHINVNEWQLLEALESKFKISGFVGHDIRSLALAEHYFGATRDCEDSLLIRVHRGTGAGIIISGRIFFGKNRNLGEIGHIQVDPLGERCYCGNFGCLENIASNAAIERQAQHLLAQGYPSKLTVDDCSVSAICKAANNGDQLAIEIIEHLGRYLGKAVAIAINLLNPQKVVITGNILESKEIFLAAIQSCINRQALKNFREHIPLVASELDHCSAIGGFALVKHSMINGVLLQKILAESVV